MAIFIATASGSALYPQTTKTPDLVHANYALSAVLDRSEDNFRLDESLVDWRTALSSSNRKVVNAVIIGDSIACCVGPQNYENAWANSLRTYTSSRYKQHGSGVIPVGNNNLLAMNPPWSLHNNTGQATMVNYGPYQTGVGAFGGVFRLTGDAELTLLVPEKHPTQLVIYYASSTDSAAGIQVHTEKRSLGIVGKVGSQLLQAHTATISLSQNAPSTLSFSSASAKGSIYVYGVEFIYDDAGVSIHNIAHGYARSEAWGADTAAQLAFVDKIPGGIQLAVINLGVNDSIDGTGSTASEFRSNIQEVISHLRQVNPSISILIYDEISTSPGETVTLLPQSLVREQEKELARTNHVGYFSPFPRWGTWSAASQLGYFGPDGVHPTDLGDRNLANLLESVLFEDDGPGWR